MARKAGQLISSGPRTWLVRISLGREPYCNYQKRSSGPVYESPTTHPQRGKRSPRTISIPALPLSVAAFCGAKKCNPCLRKVLLGQGEWPVALAPGALDTLAPEPPCPNPFSPALRKTHPLANALKPEDIVRPTIGVKLSLATRPSILAGESSVT